MQIRDVDLHVVDGGAGAPPFLLVHGYTGSSLDWADVQPSLAEHRRVVAYDQRGHGESTNTGDPASYTFDALVADLGALVDALDLAPFDLLGHSMGGIVALRYALEHPEQVRSLILMDTFAEPAGALPQDMIDGLVAKARTDGMGAVLEVMRPFMEGMMSQQPPERRAVLAARMERKIPNMDPEAFGSFARELNTYPSMVARLGELAMPVTVLVGENDTNLVQPAHVMAAAIPGAELVVFPGAGHSPQEDDPAAWLAAVEKHLARC